MPNVPHMINEPRAAPLVIPIPQLANPAASTPPATKPAPMPGRAEQVVSVVPQPVVSQRHNPDRREDIPPPSTDKPTAATAPQNNRPTPSVQIDASAKVTSAQTGAQKHDPLAVAEADAGPDPLSLGVVGQAQNAPPASFQTAHATNIQHHAPAVSQMIAEAARALPDRPVELTLSPEELGRVKMTLHSTDTAMNVVIAVERAETLDLLRRNIDMLAQDFRHLGYRDVSFSFAGQGGGQARDPSGQPQATATQSGEANKPSTAQPQPENTPHRLNLSGNGGMDLRV